MADRYVVLPYQGGWAVFRGDAEGGERLTEALPKSTAYYRRRMLAGSTAASAAPDPVEMPPTAYTGSFETRRVEGGYAVFQGDRQVTAATSLSSARATEAVRNRAEMKAKVARLRPCITCGTTFHSEGAHNRMCNGCRATAKDDVVANPYGRGVGSGLSRRA